jgi:hypothetical protein
MSWSRLPMTKTGMEINEQRADSDEMSRTFPRRMPASIPAEIPITISMMIAIKASLIVVGKPNRQFVGNRVSVERLAQITLEHIAHVEEVLDHNRAYPGCIPHVNAAT